MTPKFLCAAAVLLMLAGGCTKIGQIPPTIPITVLHSLEQDPVQSYTDSLLNIQGHVALTIDAVALNGVVPDAGQGIVAYAFRSSGYGAVVSLGVKLPGTGYEHMVTLTDSASGQVLAQAEVPTINGGHWTYVNLAIVNQAVPIVPDHGYIVSLNSLAVGNAINTYDPGNSIYIINGVYLGGAGNPVQAIFPFTRGEITFEDFGLTLYDNPLARLPLPAVYPAGAGEVQTAPGLVDIGFIPAP
ncbi:MAG TPA: hypothetical protein VHE54_00345 [Puia sp.]|nr:hypothetical protein [Puia sp.]